MRLSGLLFGAASKANDAEILASGNPKRIAKHYARKSIFNQVLKWLK